MDTAEFKHHILPVRQKLYRIAYSLLRNRQEAEDVIQDALVKLWNIRQELEQYQSVEALAVTMTKNLCLDRLKSYKSRKQDHTEIGTFFLAGDYPDPERQAEINEKMKALDRILETLPDQQKLVVHLREVEQYDYHEIAVITGIVEGTLRVIISRARKKIREQYMEQYGHEYQ